MTSTITFVTINGQSSFVFYDTSINKIYPITSLKSFNEVVALLQRDEIVSLKEIENVQDSYGNIAMIFVDKGGNQWYSVVQYDKVNNRINPPISYVMFPVQLTKSLSPSVTCLKGQIHQYGPSLEQAPLNMVYIGRNLNMGGWKLPKNKWHNPFTVKQYSRDEALRKYKDHVLSTPELLNSLHELGGKVLACWCPSKEECHGGVLVDLYNQYV